MQDSIEISPSLLNLVEVFKFKPYIVRSLPFDINNILWYETKKTSTISQIVRVPLESKQISLSLQLDPQKRIVVVNINIDCWRKTPVLSKASQSLPDIRHITHSEWDDCEFLKRTSQNWLMFYGG